MSASRPEPSFREALGVWFRIGVLSFGGPAGQIALMHRMVVEERRWIGEARFLHALNYCMLLPGPEAQQLATYVGWLLHRTWGGIAAGVLFVLPGALVMLGLSALYALYGAVPVVEAVFFGVKAAVLAIVVQAVVRIGSRALKGWRPPLLAAAAFVALFLFAVPFPFVVIAAALIGFAWGRGWSVAPTEADETVDVAGAAPSIRRAVAIALVCLVLWLTPLVVLLAALGPDNVYAVIAGFFSKMAVVTFGGAYAVLSYLAQAAVATYGWLAPGEMLDGLGLAETTPGPLILVVQHVGFLAAFRDAGAIDPLLAGILGAALTTWATFVPSFMWIFVGAPWIESLRANVRLSAALAAITAAVVGVVLNLAVWFAVHVVFGEVATERLGPFVLQVPEWASFDAAAFVIAAAALIAVFRFGIGVIPVLAGCAAAGVLWRLVGF